MLNFILGDDIFRKGLKVSDRCSLFSYITKQPRAVARSDELLPGMRTVAGSILTSGNILS